MRLSAFESCPVGTGVCVLKLLLNSESRFQQNRRENTRDTRPDTHNPGVSRSSPCTARPEIPDFFLSGQSSALNFQRLYSVPRYPNSRNSQRSQLSFGAVLVVSVSACLPGRQLQPQEEMMRASTAGLQLCSGRSWCPPPIQQGQELERRRGLGECSPPQAVHEGRGVLTWCPLGTLECPASHRLPLRPP